jgi:hypothetical protein
VAAAGDELMELIQMDLGNREYLSQKPVNRDFPENLVESEGYPIRLSDVGNIQFIDPEYILPWLERMI